MGPNTKKWGSARRGIRGGPRKPGWLAGCQMGRWDGEESETGTQPEETSRVPEQRCKVETHLPGHFVLGPPERLHNLAGWTQPILSGLLDELRGKTGNGADSRYKGGGKTPGRRVRGTNHRVAPGLWTQVRSEVRLEPPTEVVGGGGYFTLNTKQTAKSGIQLEASGLCP